MTRTAPALLWKQSQPGRRAVRLPNSDVPETPLPKELLRPRPVGTGAARDAATPGVLDLPELGELNVVRYFTQLSQLNFAIDTNFYPLGSCTMKYNPKSMKSSPRIPALRSSTPTRRRSLPRAPWGSCTICKQPFPRLPVSGP